MVTRNPSRHMKRVASFHTWTAVTAMICCAMILFFLHILHLRNFSFACCKYARGSISGLFRIFRLKTDLCCISKCKFDQMSDIPIRKYCNLCVFFMEIVTEMLSKWNTCDVCKMCAKNMQMIETLQRNEKNWKCFIDAMKILHRTRDKTIKYKIKLNLDLIMSFFNLNSIHAYFKLKAENKNISF